MFASFLYRVSILSLLVTATIRPFLELTELPTDDSYLGYRGTFSVRWVFETFAVSASALFGLCRVLAALARLDFWGILSELVSFSFFVRRLERAISAQ